MMKVAAVLPLLLVVTASAFDYELIGAGDLALEDVKTGVTNVLTLFLDEEVKVSVNDLEWNFTGVNDTATKLTYETLVDGKVQATGEVDLSKVNRELPTSVDAGTVSVSSRGGHNIQVNLRLKASSASSSGDFQAYRAGVAIIPLLVVLMFAVTTRQVELSLFAAIFVGACMISGNIKDGFKTTLETFVLEALADVGHGYVYLFTLFLSGMVGMMEKSGGMIGFTKDIARYATNSRLGQLATFSIGIFIFFDDYANVLLAGETMRPLTDLLHISREKLSFIVDGTSAPIASLTPVSSWVGFEVGLIQEQIDRIIELEGTDNLSINTSALGVFLESIKYRYYPIFMIILMVTLILTRRDFGPMLIAERKTQVYKRTDGGDGKSHAGDAAGGGDHANRPRDDSPHSSWNMIVPVLFLVFFIFYLLVKTGEVPGENQSVIDKLQESDSYVALLWGTMAAAMVSLLFYFVQIVQDGRYVVPTPSILKDWMFRKAPKEKTDDEDDETPSIPRSLMSVKDSMDSFLYGMSRIFPALVVLTLAWASGAVMIAVGADRLFSRWIVDGVSPESLPTLSFVISFFMALATGTSWGTMSILFPLILVPTFTASGGDEVIFTATTAGILSGSVAGDHVSPISDTTVLSSLACDCELLAHVSTQAPYSIAVVVLSMLVGTLPIGFDAWPNIVGILLGAVLVVAFVYGCCRPVLSRTGGFDIFTELWLKCQRGGADSPLEQLRQDTKEAFLSQGVPSQDNDENNSVEKKEITPDDDPTDFDATATKNVDAEDEYGVPVSSGDIAV